MTRLDGEKKSPLPWIIGLLVLALLAAAIYFVAAKGNGADVADQNSIEMSNAPVGTDMDANTADANMLDGNMADVNAMGTNSVDADAMDSNSAMMNNSSTMMDNSASMAIPALTPASTDSNSESNDVVATRSKTIKSDDKTVTYKKSVTADGEVMRDKTIAAEPVKEAKKP